MEERLTRYELGIIKQLHDEHHYREVSPEYLAEQLARIDLPPNASRFQVAQRVEELEKNLSNR